MHTDEYKTLMSQLTSQLCQSGSIATSNSVESHQNVCACVVAGGLCTRRDVSDSNTTSNIPTLNIFPMPKPEICATQRDFASVGTTKRSSR